MPELRRVLIANRGEIAVRVIRTCQRLGLSTVAVCSDADLSAPHVAAADEAVHIGAAESRQSYLRMERIIDAARSTGSDAVHPGYGFLSENATFAAMCRDAGLTFIGPTPEAIAAMGSKRGAKALMASHGVPVVPGYHGEDQDPHFLAQMALEVGFPLLIKASAGGGGKGMRIVREPSQLEEGLLGARREALAAFGDGALLLERYIDEPRHVEFQIFGDTHGNVVHLFERECSIQRRHQKIIEETPSPALTPALRAKMAAAAVQAGRALGYVGAGTVEFILDPAGEFYFLEVNTRLQVEHPVTELVTGLDLVALQIEVARGKALPFTQEELRSRGHAIECRLYAEDPCNGFLPSTGALVDWHLPEAPWLRVDSGVERGTQVGIHYDPLLAKVITHGADRGEAIERMIWALSRMSVVGPTHNRDFLRLVLEHPAFRAGRIHTHFIEQHFPEPESRRPEPDLQLDLEALAVATLRQVRLAQTQDPVPLAIPAGWRNNPFRDAQERWRLGDMDFAVSWRHLGGGLYRLTAAGWLVEAQILEEGGAGPQQVWTARIRLGDVIRSWRVSAQGERTHVHCARRALTLERLPIFPDAAAQERAPGAVSPMPGRIISIRVREGDEVSAGQVLVVLEAMKMEHSLAADADGVVTRINVAEGEVVDAGISLVQLTHT